MKKLFSLISFITFFQLNAQICFLQHTDYVAGTNPNAIISADFNLDGFLDLVCTNGGTNEVLVFFGNGTGTYPATGNSFTTPAVPQGMCKGNFNADAYPDIAVTFAGGGGISVLLNDGLGGFNPFTNYYGGGNPQSVTSADFNMDGFTDLVGANYGTGNVSLFLGDGAGNFGTATNFAANANPSGIATDDFNGDTYPDLVVANYGANNICILMGNGAGGFSPKVSYTVGTAPRGIITGDFNGNGSIDIAVSNLNSNNVSVLLNTGTGTFSAATNFSSTAGNPDGLTSGDFNADGIIDFAICSSFSNAAGVFIGSGTGSFASMVSFPTNPGPRSICSGDLNMDGFTDIATGNFSSNDISVLLKTIPTVINASANDTTVCQGTLVTFNGIGGVSYTWSPAFISNGVPVSIPVSALTYTVTGTDVNGCKDTDTLTVFVYAAPSLLVGSTDQTICLGTSTTVYGGGNSVSYTWSGGVIDNVPFTPTSSATYTVVGTSAAGCTATGTIPITVYPLPNVGTSASATTICLNSSVTLNGTGALSYTWSGGVTNGMPFSPTSTQTYTVTGTNSNGCTNTASQTITVIPQPIVTANASNTTSCLGAMVTLTGGGANTYSWSGGVVNGNPFTTTVTQTYTVTGTDANNCNNTATVNINVLTPQTPEICMVTVDSLSINNVIMWDKTLYSGVDTFLVYRDTANNAYGLIGRVPADSMSLFVDTMRTIYAANGDPQASSWRYKIAIKDSCGNIGLKSNYHQSIFMQNNTGNFSWSDYKVEGQAVPVPVLNNYLFKRDNLANGNYLIIQTLSASSVSYTDPQYATYQSTANWRIETQWSLSCDPSRSIVNTSRSNIKSQLAVTLGLNNQAKLDFSIYPNPAKNELTILSSKSPIKIIEIKNILGQTVLSFFNFTKSSTQQNINVQELSTGVYFVSLVLEDGSKLEKRLIKE